MQRAAFLVRKAEFFYMSERRKNNDENLTLLNKISMLLSQAPGLLFVKGLIIN